MATVEHRAPPLDPSRPLTEQFGGRLLTGAEALALIDKLWYPDGIEYLEMNLRHLEDTVAAPGFSFNAEALGLLIAIGDQVKATGSQLAEWGESIQSTAKALYWHGPAGELRPGDDA